MSWIWRSIKSAGVKIGIDPLGGAAVHYWQPIIEHYGINATIVNEAVDPTFRFMTADWDGKIRMDCSSPFAMASLIQMRDKFDVAFANDTDADRHGIVTRTNGLMNPNHFLAAAIAYLFEHRPQWSKQAAIGKTIVSSSIIDRVASKLNRKLVETPVGFKWFVEGLGSGAFGFAGEESAGASFLKRDGSVWTTDKDGVMMGLARGRNPRQNRPRPEPVVCGIDGRTRRALLRADRRAGDAQTEKRAEGARAGAARYAGARRRCRPRGPHQGARQRSILWRHQGRDRMRDGSPHGRRAPRMSTRSTRKVSATRAI